LLIPVNAADRAKHADPSRLAAVLRETEVLAKERDPKADDALLAEFGEVDPTDWSMEATRAFFESRKR
jgi:hypothetical protein